MAYSAEKYNTCQVPCEPAVIGPIRVTRSTGDLEYPVKIPWKHCRLVYAYAMCTTVVATADFEIDIELNAAGGTEMMSITLPTAASAVGGVAEATVTTPAACENLDRDDTDRQKINIEVNLHASAAAAADVWMFFESANIS